MAMDMEEEAPNPEEQRTTQEAPKQPAPKVQRVNAEIADASVLIVERDLSVRNKFGSILLMKEIKFAKYTLCMVLINFILTHILLLVQQIIHAGFNLTGSVLFLGYNIHLQKMQPFVFLAFYFPRSHLERQGEIHL